MSHDPPAAPTSAHAGRGLVIALASASAYAFAGILGKPLLDAGWSPAAVLVARAGLGAALLAPAAVAALRGRWSLLRRAAPTVLAYGVFGVMVVMLGFYLAVRTLPVGLALMIEYLCIVAVMVWMWLRHGQRPGLLALGGLALALVGLALVLDLSSALGGGAGAPGAGASGSGLDWRGVGWALLGMVGLTVYFLVSAHGGAELPPLALASAGLATGAAVVALLGALGVMPLVVTGGPVTLGGLALPAWALAVGLGLVPGAAAYASGIMAGRALGAGVASVVALAEVLIAMALAWALLGERMTGLQVAGSALLVAGVALVRMADLRRPA